MELSLNLKLSQPTEETILLKKELEKQTLRLELEDDGWLFDEEKSIFYRTTRLGCHYYQPLIFSLSSPPRMKTYFISN